MLAPPPRAARQPRRPAGFPRGLPQAQRGHGRQHADHHVRRAIAAVTAQYAAYDAPAAITRRKPKRRTASTTPAPSTASVRYGRKSPAEPPRPRTSPTTHENPRATHPRASAKWC
nr:hypothetical protein GCM10017745_63050 [Saccharothrix mutabilis subsp. capreolus]